MPVSDRHANLADMELIAGAARSGGEIALSYFRKDPRRWTKENDSPVSEADLAVDRHLAEVLRAARPDYGWLSEETADDRSRLETARSFVVDPIDGTRGFLSGSGEWTVAIAVVEAGPDQQLERRSDRRDVELDGVGVEVERRVAGGVRDDAFGAVGHHVESRDVGVDQPRLLLHDHLQALRLRPSFVHQQ